MFQLIVCLCVVVLVTDGAQSKGHRLPDGVSLHKVAANFADARLQCESEGLVLASPLNDKILNMMRSLVGTNTSYYIGTWAPNESNKYISLEGVPFDNMTGAVMDMVQPVHRSQGECLAMDDVSIRAVPCWLELPYLCYDSRLCNNNVPTCEPHHHGYKYNETTGSCYKLHMELLSWPKAQQACVGEGAHLVIINDADEAEVVRKIYDFVDTSWIFVGLHDYTGKGHWFYVDWQPVQAYYNIWSGASGPSSQDTACGTIHSSGHLWNRNCNEKRHFICERQP